MSQRSPKGFANCLSTWALLLVAALIMAQVRSADGGTIYVDQSAGGKDTGASWDDAFVDLQSALDQAQSGDEIWVAEGLYVPSRRRVVNDPRSATFLLKGTMALALYGGFAGIETKTTQRDWRKNITVLSGDLLGNDRATRTVDDPERMNDDNAYHVVTAQSDNPGTGGAGIALDGFLVVGGNATPQTQRMMDNRASHATVSNGKGGGLSAVNVRMDINNCGFVGNLANEAGGGMACIRSPATVSGCYFWGNVALRTGGGGAYIARSTASFQGCVFSFNRAGVENDSVVNIGTLDGDGGGLALVGSHETGVLNCLFLGNEAAGDGGGYYSAVSTKLMVYGSVFAGNACGDFGGGAYRPMDVINCTAVGNFAGNAGGGMATVYDGGLRTRVRPIPQLRNSIVWGNTAENDGHEIFGVKQAFAINHSLVMHSESTGQVSATNGGDLVSRRVYFTRVSDNDDDFKWSQSATWAAAGNTIEDPRFADAYGKDGVLGTMDDDLSLLAGSPAIDAASAQHLPRDETDMDADGDTDEPIPFDPEGQPRIHGERPDIGAYEWTPEAGPGDYESSFRSVIIVLRQHSVHAFGESGSEMRAAAVLASLLRSKKPLLCIHPDCARDMPFDMSFGTLLDEEVM